MSVALRAAAKRAPATRTRSLPAAPERGSPPAEIAALARTAAAHLHDVQPVVRTEIARWRVLAREISDPALRRVALQSLRKRGNIEGAALLATLAARQYRGEAIRAQVAFQAAYNYLDELSELREDGGAAPAVPHDALLEALAPRDTLDRDGRATYPRNAAISYLDALVDAARRGLSELPGYAAVAPFALAAAARIRDFQALNLSAADGGHCALRAWAAQLLPPGSGYCWWETAGGAGSSLPVHALIAAAGHASLRRADAEAIAIAYFPAVGALHSLLDSVADRAEDAQAGRPSLLDPYGSPEAVALGIAALSRRAAAGVAALPGRERHRVVLAAMSSYYLTDHGARTPEARLVRKAVSETLGSQLELAIGIFAGRRALHRLARQPYV